MNPIIQQLKEDRIRKEQQLDQEAINFQNLKQLQDFEQTFVSTMQAFVQYLEKKVTKTEVVNQLKEIGTPDALKVAQAVNAMHQTLASKKETDLTEVTGTLKALLAEVQAIPKQHQDLPEQKDSLEVTNLPDFEKYFTDLEHAVNGIADKEIPAPVVNVPEAVVNLPAPVVTVDNSKIEKPLKDAIKAIKAIVIPAPQEIDLTEVEKHLKKSNKYLEEISKIRLGGGSGGGHATPYQNISGAATYVSLDADGAIPTTTTAYAVILDDTTTADTVYICKAPIATATSSASWQIVKLNTSSGLIKTWADGDALFNNVADNRASLSYL